MRLRPITVRAAIPTGRKLSPIPHRPRTTVVRDRQSKIPRRGGATPRLRVGIVGRPLREARSQHVGVDDSRVDGEASHAIGQFLRHRLGQTFDRPLRRTIGGDVRRSGRPQPLLRLTITPLLSGDHCRQKVPQHVGHARHIDPEQLVELGGGNLVQRRVAVNDGRVVEQ